MQQINVYLQGFYSFLYKYLPLLYFTDLIKAMLVKTVNAVKNLKYLAEILPVKYHQKISSKSMNSRSMHGNKGNKI